MNKIFRIFCGMALLILFTAVSYSQTITGKVSDASNSDVLPGAIVKIQGTNNGAEADLNGLYTIEQVQPGTYTLEFSYLGYDTKTVSGVVVKQGEVTRLDIALGLPSKGIETEEITIETTTSLANEQALLTEQKNSDKVQDGISEQQIKRAPDAAASEVLKRVTGVNIVNDKFVFVRGTSERYSNTSLNGVIIPSTEPDKKAFSFDIFPSNLLENIIIVKSYTPDLPANFSGGLVQINTKDFPESFTLNFSTSGSYNTMSTGKDFLSYDAENTKLAFLNTGVDNGSREIPSNFPGNKITLGNYDRQVLKNFGKSFRNDWGQRSSSAPANGGFQLSFGNKYKVGKNPLGIFAAYTYNNSFATRNIARTEYQADGNLEQQFSGVNSEYQVLMGGILNLSYKLGDNNKISIKNSLVMNSEDETQFTEGTFLQQIDKRLYSTSFKQRNVVSSQLFGEHYFHSLNRLRVTWKGSYSEASSDQPDYKTMVYQRQTGSGDPFTAPITITGNPNTSVGGRFFSNLKDINRSFEINFEMPFQPVKKINSKMKFGTYAYGLDRDFSARLFAPYLSNQINIFEQIRIVNLPIDSIFLPENIDTNKIVFSEFTDQSDSYNALENQYAGYLMFDVPIGRLKVVTGARYEYNEQKLNTYEIANGRPAIIYLKNIDILPSVNLTYALTDETNLRFSYFQSISRPELRELAPFGFNDFNSNIYIYGNPQLRRTLIRNYDMRFEIFPNAGELASISLFYKKIDRPIERTFTSQPGSDTKTNSFQNADNGAENYGVELEIRKSLGFISKYMDNFAFNGNVSIVNSKVDISGTGSTETKTERRLQGQSPYNLNLGLYYDNSKSGTSINLLYNRSGSRISEVGIGDFGDVEENGRDILDFSASQKFLQRFEGKLTVRNLLNKKQIYTQDVNGQNQTVRIFDSGVTYGFTLGYKF